MNRVPLGKVNHHEAKARNNVKVVVQGVKKLDGEKRSWFGWPIV